MHFRRSIPVFRLFLAAVAVAALALGSRPAEAQTTANVTLTWTAPGDDGIVGRASHYDLRYSANTIAGTDTLSWWNAATIVNLVNKIPAPAGQADSVVVSSLPTGVRYFAMIRTADEVPNWSGFSNLAVIDLTDKTAPARIADLRVR